MSNKKIYGLDLRSLGVFRIILGITLIYDLIFNKYDPNDKIYVGNVQERHFLEIKKSNAKKYTINMFVAICCYLLLFGVICCY